MKKNIVKINEGQLRKMIAESVRRVMKENFDLYDNEMPDFSLSEINPGTKLGTITVPAYEFCDALNLPEQMYDKFGWQSTEWDFDVAVGQGGQLVLKPSSDFVKALNEVLPGKGKKAMSLFTKYIQDKIENDDEFRDELSYFAKFGADPNDFR